MIYLITSYDGSMTFSYNFDDAVGKIWDTHILTNLPPYDADDDAPPPLPPLHILVQNFERDGYEQHRTMPKGAHVYTITMLAEGQWTGTFENGGEHEQQNDEQW